MNTMSPAMDSPASGLDRRTSIGILALFAIAALLFQYRTLSLLKKLGAHVSPFGSKFPVTFETKQSPLWEKPFLFTADYLNGVWFSTILGLLIAGAVSAFLPYLVRRYAAGNTWNNHAAGIALGLPMMLCTCCASCSLPGLRKSGFGLRPLLGFFITAPSLNIVTVILAFKLLPLSLAVCRLGLGIAAAIGLPYLVTKWGGEIPAAGLESTLAAETEPDQSLWKGWLTHTWRAVMMAVPPLVGGIFLIGVLSTFMPLDEFAKHVGHGPGAAVLAAAMGTLVMVPTFTEVVLVKEMTSHGMGLGPVLALLISLPAVSFPSLLVLARACKSPRTAFLLGGGVFLLSAAAGLLGTLFS
jgi:hypothetical protein